MIIEAITYGSVAIVSGLLGRIEGFSKGQQIKNVTSLFLNPKTTPDSLWCLCGHAMSMHNNKKDRCRWCNRNRIGEIVNRCDCRAFIGDPQRTLADQEAKNELDL